jgi:hypothetical protein
MTATLIGSLNCAALNPISASVILPVGAQLEANLTAALALQASVSITPPTLAVQLAAVLEAAAAIEAGIALGLPGITFSVSAAASLVASARLAIGLLGDLTALLGGPAMYVYAYEGGTVSTLGSDLSSAIASQPPPGLAGPSACAGLLIGAGATAWANIGPYFGGLAL